MINLWDFLEDLGKRTGHLVARCPRCEEKQMIGYISESAPPPKCRVCRPDPPNVEILSDRSAVLHKKPGQPINQTLMKVFGYIKRPNVSTECISIDILRPVERLAGADPASACKRWLSAHSEPSASDPGRLIDRAEGG